MKSSVTKSEQLQIRVSAEQKARLKAAAAAAHMSVSEYVLATLFAPDETRFQDLLARLAAGEDRRLLLAELHDFLEALAPAAFRAAVATQPAMALDAFLSNYVAAMIEVAAHRKGEQAPLWTVSIAPLSEPYFGTPLASLRLYLLTHSPPPFRRRNIFIDASLGARV